MALQYLLSPTFQFVNTAGKPMTGGAYLEVYVHGTRNKYFCASDFNGTLHPFRIPLDSLGSNIVLAQDGQAYDVYAYNRYGNLMMSRYNVTPGSGGGGIGGIIYSSDGSVQVIPTDNGIDLSVNGIRPTVLKVAAAPLGTDGQFVFDALQVEGEGLSVDNAGRIRMQPGWYHYDVTVELAWEENPRNESRQVSLYTTLSRSVIDIDLSFQHTETIQFSGDVHCVEEGAQMVFGVSGMPTGLVASVTDAGMHSITGKTGDGSRYLAGEGINIDANNYISADLDVVQHKLTAGSNIEIVGNTINATAAPQQQADWAVTDTTSPKFILNKPQLASVATSGSYNDLTNKPTIPAAQVPADWNASSGVSRILNKPDLSVYARSGDLATVATSGSYDDLSDKPTIPAAQVNADWNSNSGVTKILNKPDLGVFARSADLAEVATTGDYDDLRNKPSIPAAQVNADWNSNSGVSQILNKPNLATVATTGNYNDLSGRPSIPAAQVNADWNASSGVAEILNKPALFSGDYDDLTDKPDLSVYAEKSELATVATSGSYDDLTDKPSIPSFTPAQQAAIDSGVNSAKVGAYDTHVADTTIHVTAADKTAWNGKQDAISDLNTIRSGAAAGATAVQPGDLATVAETGAYSDLSGTPTIPTATSDLTNDSGFITLSDVPAQQNADWNSTGGASEILNKPTIPSGTQLVPAATASDADKVLTVDAQGVPGWANAQAPISAGSGIDITNNVVSAKVDGTSVSFNAQGQLQSAAGTQADWAETDPADPSYIVAKPVPKTLAAGTGISITENQSTITIANTSTVDQTYDASSANAQSGVAVASAISGKQDTLTAGAGITITNNVISASYNETVLFDAVSNNGDSSKTITLSENYTNFDHLTVYYRINDGDCGSVNILPITGSSWDLVTAANYSTDTADNDGTNILKAIRLWLRNGNQLTKSNKLWFQAGNGAPSVETNGVFYILKVVGCGRIASN